MFNFFKRDKDIPIEISEDVGVGVATRNNSKPSYVNSSGSTYTLSTATAPTSTQALTTSEVIFTCTDFISSSLSQVRFVPVVRDNKTNSKIPYNNKAVTRAFSIAPSPTSTWSELLGVVGTQLLLDGESFITVETVGKQLEFTAIDSDTSVEILFDAKHPEIPTGYQIGDTVYTLDEMIHIKRVNITGNLHGQSILESLVDPLVVDGYASNDLISLYENGSVGEVYLHSDNPLAPKQVEQIERKLTQKYTKGGRHRTFILPNGLRPESLKISPKDAVILDAMMISEDRILRAFKLHRTALGGAVDSYTNDMLSLDSIQFNHAVRPLLNLIKDKFEVTLRRKFKKDDLILDIDYTNLPEIARSLTSHTDTARALYSSGLATLNEARELVGLPTISDPLANENFLPEFLHGSSLMSIQGLDAKQLDIIREAKVAEAQGVIDGSHMMSGTQVTQPLGADDANGGKPNGNKDNSNG